MRRQYFYDKDSGIARVVLSKKGCVGQGTAKLHPDDAKYASEFTGLTLAELRAQSDFFKKRSKKKKRAHEHFQKVANNFKVQYEEDLERASLLEALASSYIEEKSILHKKLNNPPKRVEWNNLPDNFFLPKEIAEDDKR